jgi:hypothetical protein
VIATLTTIARLLHNASEALKKTGVLNLKPLVKWPDDRVSFADEKKKEDMGHLAIHNCPFTAKLGDSKRQIRFEKKN